MRFSTFVYKALYLNRRNAIEYRVEISNLPDKYVEHEKAGRYKRKQRSVNETIETK